MTRHRVDELQPPQKSTETYSPSIDVPGLNSYSTVASNEKGVTLAEHVVPVQFRSTPIPSSPPARCSSNVATKQNVSHEDTLRAAFTFFRATTSSVSRIMGSIWRLQSVQSMTVFRKEWEIDARSPVKLNALSITGKLAFLYIRVFRPIHFTGYVLLDKESFDTSCKLSSRNVCTISWLVANHVSIVCFAASTGENSFNYARIHFPRWTGNSIIRMQREDTVAARGEV